MGRNRQKRKPALSIQVVVANGTMKASINQGVLNMYYCDCCFHPVKEDSKHCPFCLTSRKTKKCDTCHSYMVAIPSEFHEDKTQLICQDCAMNNRPQIAKKGER